MSRAQTPTKAHYTGVTCRPCSYGTWGRGAWRTPSGKEHPGPRNPSSPQSSLLLLSQDPGVTASLLSPLTCLSGLPAQWSWEGWQALELRGGRAVPELNRRERAQGGTWEMLELTV